MNSGTQQNTAPKLGPPPAGYEAPMKYAQLDEAIKNEPTDIVERFLSAKNIDALIGDSGLGKTPLAVQLGLCLAAGKPFLGLPVQQAAVLYIDYENGRRPFGQLLVKLSHFLELPGVPDTFRYMQGGDKRHVEYAIRQLRQEFPTLPIVVIVDTLRGFDPKMESKNESAADEITRLRDKLARPLNVTFLVIHHIRKSSEDPNASTPLFSTDIMKWLERASGARALITQSNFRIGFDQHNVGEAERVIKGHCKLIGQFGPMLIARVYDDEGEAIGWKKLSGVELIPTDDGQRDKFVSLPDEFTFKHVEPKAGNPKKAAAWLQAWAGFGVIVKVGKTKSKKAHYVKTAEGKSAQKSAGPKKKAEGIVEKKQRLEKEAAERDNREWESVRKAKVLEIFKDWPAGEKHPFNFDVKNRAGALGLDSGKALERDLARAVQEKRIGNSGGGWGDYWRLDDAQNATEGDMFAHSTLPGGKWAKGQDRIQ